MSDTENSYDCDDSDNSYLSDTDTVANTILDDSVSQDYTDSKDLPQSVKKKPIKTLKLELKDALKTVDERALYTKIDRFFNTECDTYSIQKMVKIIENVDPISLRLLNWFAMKHSATMQSLEVVNDDDKVELFDVKISYRARLNTHSKKYFDPFRRGRKFDYFYDKNDKTKAVETTLCQLNFFRWLFIHNLLDYVEEHFDELKNKMGIFNNSEKKKKDIKKTKDNKTIIKNKKEDIKVKVRRFTEENVSKLIIII